MGRQAALAGDQADRGREEHALQQAGADVAEGDKRTELYRKVARILYLKESSMIGIAEQSTMRKPSTPRTRRRSSTMSSSLGPIAQPGATVA